MVFDQAENVHLYVFLAKEMLRPYIIQLAEKGQFNKKEIRQEIHAFASSSG